MNKVMVANRGEIAVRILRTCRDMGLRSVVAYADSDADALFVKMADEAYALNGNSASETYLDIAKLIDIAKRAGADAVHPGYGFLSERSEFARAVTDAGLIWVGPSADVIEALGDKLKARDIARKVGAPLVKGSDGPVASAAEAVAFARQFGLPLAIKAAHGGGGRGLKIVRDMDEVADQFESATREAVAAFGRGECYIEQYLDRPRHIEAQVLADCHGTVVVVGTRDCSVQRRNQKLIEEAPAPFLTDAQRLEIEQASVRICSEAGYVGAGTVEFLLSVDGVVSFLEVNTRLQVEHPVTEETTGLDLVREQLRIAQELPLAISATPVARGHAIEFRINIEDPGRGFMPMAGTISHFGPPSGPGVRLDSGVATGSLVPASFDSLVAKLIVWAPDREQAMARARRALAEFRIEGVPSVLPFHRLMVEHEDFAGERFGVHTRWIETDFAGEIEAAERPAFVANDTMLRGTVEIDGRLVEIGLPSAFLSLIGQGAPRPVEAKDGGADETGAVRAPAPGTLSIWRVADGDQVEAGGVIAIMEAMKMETEIRALQSGVIKLAAAAGSYQNAGDVIAWLAPGTKINPKQEGRV